MKTPQKNPKFAKTSVLPTFPAKIPNLTFFEGKPKNHILGGYKLKTPKRIPNMLTLGYHLPFKQNIQKFNFFDQKPKIYVLGGATG